jgi:DNA-binding transcriptional regulator YhcF (GntR family)
MVAKKRSELAEVLRQRFFSALHLGLLRPGSRLPSAREMAASMHVDRRVVLAAYRELEREGLVELRERSGIYFAHRAPGVPGSRLTPPAEWAVDVLAQGLSNGIPASEFADRFHSYLSTLRLRTCCIECNEDQVESLCAELASDYGLEASGADVDELLLEETPRADVRRADLLVTTPFHAGEVREIAERAGRPWIAVSLRTDIYAEIARLLRTKAVYFVVVDPRYAKKLRKIFSSTVGSDGFHAVVVGQDDTKHIPETAPTYITRVARARLDDTQLLERVIPEERVFSTASAREILSLIVRANMAALESKRTGK